MVAAVVAVAGVAVSAYSSNKQTQAAKKAGQAGADASAASIAEQQREYDQTRTDQQPWMQAGQNTLGKQNAFLSGDWSGFKDSPDYLYARDQGLNTIDHRAAARGGLFGGGNTRDAITFGEGLATQNANGYYDKLAGMSHTGIETAQNLGGLGANMATNIGNQYQNGANARASAYQGQANAASSFANQAGQWGAWYAGQNNFGGV